MQRTNTIEDDDDDDDCDWLAYEPWEMESEVGSGTLENGVFWDGTLDLLWLFLWEGRGKRERELTDDRTANGHFDTV